MTDHHKIDHEMKEHNGHNIVGNGAELSRQVTVQLSPEQYERLFFQPSAPRRGDLAKRFGMLHAKCLPLTSVLIRLSQPNIAGFNWILDTLHIDHLYPLRLPECRCASDSDWVERRLLLLRMHRDGPCWRCRICPR